VIGWAADWGRENSSSGALPTSCSVCTWGWGVVVQRPGHAAERPHIVPLLGVREATIYLHTPNTHWWYAKGQVYFHLYYF